MAASTTMFKVVSVLQHRVGVAWRGEEAWGGHTRTYCPDDGVRCPLLSLVLISCLIKAKFAEKKEKQDWDGFRDIVEGWHFHISWTKVKQVPFFPLFIVLPAGWVCSSRRIFTFFSLIYVYIYPTIYRGYLFVYLSLCISFKL